MSEGEQVEEAKPTEGTLALIYDEIGEAQRVQHDYAESLNARAQQLFGFATIIFAILAAVVPTHPSVALRVLYGVALPIFAGAAYFSARAWKFRDLRFDPNVLNLWEDFRLKTEEYVRHQVIQNRRESIPENAAELDDKLYWIKRAQVCLYGGFLYVGVLLLYQVIRG